MEMNLYGVASIRLDKMRGNTSKNLVRILFGVYFLALIVSLMLPSPFLVFRLGEAEPVTIGDD